MDEVLSDHLDEDDDLFLWDDAVADAADGSKCCAVCRRAGMVQQARFCGYCGSRFPPTASELLPTQEQNSVLVACTPPSAVGSVEKALLFMADEDERMCDMDTVADCEDDVMDMEMLRLLEETEQRAAKTPQAIAPVPMPVSAVPSEVAVQRNVDDSAPRRQLPSWMQTTDALAEQSRQLRDMKESMRAQPLAPSSGATAVSIPFVQYHMLDTLAGNWWKQKRVIVFDVETTGFGKTDSLLELGAVELVDGRRTGCHFQSHMRPLSTSTIHPMARQCHGLSDAFLALQPSAEFVVSNFLRFIGGSPLVAHNADFDMRLFCQELDRLKLPLPNNSVFCTMRYERRVHSVRPSYTLSAVAASRRIAAPERLHGALVDAQLCAAIFADMLDELQQQQRDQQARDVTSANGARGVL